MLPAPRRGGGAAGLCPAAGPLPGLARQRAGGLRPPAAPACPPRLSCFPCVTAVMPAEARWPRGGGERWVTRGAAAFGRPRGGPAGRPSAAKQKSGPGDKGPGAALSGRAAPSRRPPEALEFPPSKRSIHQPFPASPSCKPTWPAAPDARRACIFRRKSAAVFQPVFPRFFQKRQGGGAERRQWRKKRGGSPVSKGVEGCRLGGDAQRPLRTACGGLAAPHMAPPTGSGAAPRQSSGGGAGPPYA